MNGEAHRSIDVDVFKEILDNEFFTGDRKENITTDLLDLVKKIHTIELRIPGIDLDRKKESAKIKYKKYGFKTKADFAFEYKQDVFENETIILLIPLSVYELEDMVKSLPVPYCERGKKLLLILSDSFERLKIKSKNILQNSTSDKQITHYAKKNIQVALRNCYDARMFLIKIQKTKNRDAIFLVFMVNIFMINVLAYLTKMFSYYYTEKDADKNMHKAELFDVLDFNVLMEPEAEYKKKKEPEVVKQEVVMPKFKWNLQVNQLLTLVYDLQQVKDENDLPVLQADIKDIQDIIHNTFVDKNGKPINKTTIKTCLSESRNDKRSQRNKRIDVKKYL